MPSEVRFFNTKMGVADMKFQPRNPPCSFRKSWELRVNAPPRVDMMEGEEGVAES